MIWKVLAACATLLVAACTVSVGGDPEELGAEVDAILEELARREGEPLLARMSSANDPEQVRTQLPGIMELVPEGPVPEGVPVSFEVTDGEVGGNYRVERTYAYADRTLRAHFIFDQESGEWKVLGLNIQVEPPASGQGSGPAAD